MKWFALLVLLFGELLFAAAPSGELKPMIMGMPFQAKRIKSILQYQQFINEALATAGYKVSIRTSKGRQVNDLLIRGEIGCLAYDDKTWIDGREKTVSLSFPIIHTTSRVFYLSKNKDFNESRLRDYRGAVSIHNQILNKEAMRRKLKYVNNASPLHSVADLINGKIDYFVAIQEVGISAIESHPEAKGKVTHGESTFLDVALYLTFAKKYESDLPKIEEAFRKALKGDLSRYPLIKDRLNTDP